MLEPGAVVEHRSSRHERWLRDRRVRIALWIAVIEGILLVFGAIPRILALVIAIAVVAGYFWLGHRLRPRLLRDAGWIAAVSQALVMLVPVLVILIGTLTLIVVAGIAVIALIILFTNRH
jgi:hypothetical protein